MKLAIKRIVKKQRVTKHPCMPVYNQVAEPEGSPFATSFIGTWLSSYKQRGETGGSLAFLAAG